MTVATVIAQVGPCWGAGQGGMGPGWDMGGAGGAGGFGPGGWVGFGFLGPLLWFVVLVVIIAAAYLLITRLGEDGDGALATLRERYARGEIDTDEFEHRLAHLSEPAK